MKVKNILLFGFVYKAAEYLKDEFEKNGQVEELNQLNGLELGKLKKELIDNVGNSLIKLESTVSSLMKIGGDAFDEFVDKKEDPKANLLKEFTDIFENKKENVSDLLSFYQPVKEKEETEEDEFLQIIAKEAEKARELKEEVKPKENANNKDLDDIFNEIVNSENSTKKVVEKNPEVELKVEQEVKPQVVVEEKPKVKTAGLSEEYIKSLVEELQKKINAEKAEPVVEEKVSVFDKISQMYPYLTGGFIRAVYDLRPTFSREYAVGEKIIILHRIHFKELDYLRQFVEIVSNHDYTVNVDEVKMIVDVFKEHENAEGKILTNIFEISNQARVLDGEYEGYRIVKKED